MSMQCPKCKVPLESFEIEGANYDLCGSCQGMWFDNDELVYYLKPRIGQGNLEIVEKNAQDTSLSCPRCQSTLKEMKFVASTGSGITGVSDLLIDRCPSCKGIWLDKGELAKAEHVSSKLPPDEKRFAKVLSGANSFTGPTFSDRSWFSPLSFLLGIGLFLFTAFGISSYAHKKSAQSPQAGQTVCVTCHGTGKHLLICQTCSGLGRVAGPAHEETCDECEGTGKFLEGATHGCPKCSGTGWIQEAERACASCSGTGRSVQIVKETCGTCSGTGQMLVRQTCNVCNGSGKSSINPQWGCANCNGRGAVEIKKTCTSCQGGVIERKVNGTCQACNGRGRVTPERKVCDECMGTGELEASSNGACYKCGGTGRIMVPSAERQACADCQGKGNLGEAVCETCLGKGVL